MSQAGQFQASVLPPGTVVETLQGNSGGPVSPNGFNNLFVEGDGTTILVAGNPATNTLTISSLGDATHFVTDSGTAIPVGGIINIVGGKGIVTSASGNTITVASTGIFFTYIDVNTSPYTVLTDDVYLSVDSTGGPITIIFPNPALVGEPYIVKDRTGTSAVNNITITTVGGVATIDGVTSFIMDSAYQALSIVDNGTSYEIY